jgi:hypothetical membrane protein
MRTCLIGSGKTFTVTSINNSPRRLRPGPERTRSAAIRRISLAAQREHTFSRRAVFGAVLLILCALQFVVGEKIAASAWVSPRYGYAHYYISDLGVTACDGKCSPLHTVMNVSFVLLGVLFLAATVLLIGYLPRRARTTQILLAVLFAMGLAAVAAIHAQPQSGRLVLFHAIGALVALLVSNYSLVRIGAFARKLQAPQSFTVACIVLGSTGLVCTCLFAIVSPTLPRPIFERAATYAFLLGCVITGIAILYSQANRERRPGPARGVIPPEQEKSQT